MGCGHSDDTETGTVPPAARSARSSAPRAISSRSGWRVFVGFDSAATCSRAAIWRVLHEGLVWSFISSLRHSDSPLDLRAHGLILGLASRTSASEMQDLPVPHSPCPTPSGASSAGVEEACSAQDFGFINQSALGGARPVAHGWRRWQLSVLGVRPGGCTLHVLVCLGAYSRTG